MSEARPLFRSADPTREGSSLLTVPGVGLVEIVTNENGINRIITTEPLAPEQQLRLAEWVRDEWPTRTS